MSHRLIRRIRRRISFKTVEHAGLLACAIGLLLFGLRLVLLGSERALVSALLTTSAKALLALALLLWIVAALLSAARLLRSLLRTGEWAAGPPLPAYPLGLVMLAGECLLAAVIVWSALDWAARSTIGGWPLLQLLGCGLLHLFLGERVEQARLSKRAAERRPTH